ncbi:MAG: alpha-glucosidase C-terminal domain-containing protein, partial [Polyangiales bacterium]
VHGGVTRVVDTGNPHLVAYLREHSNQRLLIVTNFAEMPQRMEASFLCAWAAGTNALDHLSGPQISFVDGLVLDHHRAVWLDLAPPQVA